MAVFGSTFSRTLVPHDPSWCLDWLNRSWCVQGNPRYSFQGKVPSISVDRTAIYFVEDRKKEEQREQREQERKKEEDSVVGDVEDLLAVGDITCDWVIPETLSLPE